MMLKKESLSLSRSSKEVWEEGSYPEIFGTAEEPTAKKWNRNCRAFFLQEICQKQVSQRQVNVTRVADWGFQDVLTSAKIEELIQNYIHWPVKYYKTEQYWLSESPNSL
jgi:hypothetical protein